MIRKPHTTPQTLVVNWDREPKTYHGECNVGQCRWASAPSQEVGRAKAAIEGHGQDCSNV